MRALLSITLVAALASSPVAAQTNDDPAPAFEAALVRLNAQAAFGETYIIGEMKRDGVWAYAIAVPATASGVGGITPHRFVPLIGVYEGGWSVVAPSPSSTNATEFNALLFNLPDALMDEATKNFVAQPVTHGPLGPLQAQNIAGHKLPWAKDVRAFIAQRDGSGHNNQVDFDINGLASAADVLASKPGTVVFVKESSNGGGCSGVDFSTVWKKTNVVVVKHGNADYSWYVHLAHNSVPVNVGDAVQIGTKVGVEGNTGFACGVHIHYMTSTAIPATWTNPANPDEAPWAPSGSLQPTDFDESPWAGLTVGNWIVSGNDSNGPCGAPALQSPADGAVITTSIVLLSWSAVGNCTFDGYAVRIKTVSDPNTGGTTLFDATEHTLSRAISISPTWSYQDLYWSVRANSAGTAWATRRLRVEPTITGTYTLFDQPDFAGEVFTGSTTVTDLSTVGFDNRTRSLKVDAGIGLVLCTDAGMRGECGRATGSTQIVSLSSSMQSLEDDVSAVRACAGPCPPAPLAPAIAFPISGTAVLSGTPLMLKWQGDGDAFRAEVSGGALTTTLVLDWASGLQRGAGKLAASNTPYRLRVRAANAFGTSPWAEQAFIVAPAQLVFVPNVRR